MKQVFITGTNGLLGTNLCNELINKGYKVVGLVRNKKSFKGIKHKNLQLYEGDLFTVFTSVLNTTDIVIHVAAITDQNILNYSDYYKVNYEATVKLFNEAVNSKVKRFVFVSTANTLGYGSLNKLGSENEPMSQLFKQSYYAKSKFEAENYVLNNKHKMHTTIMNPTFMLGAYDTKPSSGKIILMGWKKRIIFYPPGGKNFVYVNDVVTGILNSFTVKNSGEKFLLCNENLSYKSFFKVLNTTTNQSPVMIKIPKYFLYFLGIIGNILRFLKIRTSISYTNMKALCIYNYFSNEKSKAILKINYSPTSVAIKKAVDYFK